MVLDCEFRNASFKDRKLYLKYQESGILNTPPPLLQDWGTRPRFQGLRLALGC